jgi:uracil-DNA glycosylase
VARKLAAIEREVTACRACPRLVAFREESAGKPPRRFRGQRYWALPVPGFGDPGACLFIVGLAPAAHGGNRTGRVFTGDSSGDFLFAALHRAGFASQARSEGRGDGLVLRDCFIAAAVRCAPPDNKPTPEEFETCRPFLVREVRALEGVRVVLALGALAWRSALATWDEAGHEAPKPLPGFGHAAEARLGGGVLLLGSYHVSRQNTNTGVLTAAMLDTVLTRARSELAEPSPRASEEAQPKGRIGRVTREDA